MTPLAAWWLCLVKDLREVVRDRRALIMQLVVPALVGPLAMLAVAAIGSQVERGGSEPVRIGVVGDGLDTLITGRGATVAALADWPAGASAALPALRSAGLPAVIVVTATGAAVWLDGAHPQALAARQAAGGAADDWREARRDALLAAAGVPASASALTVTMHDTAPRSEQLRSHLGWPLLLILALVAAAAAATVAADLVAGARERGTRDWAWALPVPRSTQVLATATAVTLSAAVAATMNLASLAATLGILGGKIAGGGGLDGAAALLLPGMAAVLPLAVAVGCWATAMAHGSASSREAQSALAPLVVVVLGLGLGGCLPALRPGLPWDLVPITGLVLALRDAMQGGAPWGHLALAVASTLAAGGLGAALAVRLAGQDLAVAEDPPVPDLLAAGLTFLAAVAGFLATGIACHGGPPWLATGLPLLVLGAVPVLVSRWRGWDLAAGLGLRRVPVETLLWSVLIGLGALLVSGLCAGAQSVILPADEDMAAVERQIRDVLGGIRAAGGLPLLLLVVAVIPGVCEELLCRGLLLSAVRRRLGPRIAVWSTAIVFAALHGSEYRFLPQLVLGLLLGLLTLRTGSVLPAMVVHAVHNGIVVVAMEFSPAP
jgi:sodium transport system permease protein